MKISEPLLKEFVYRHNYDVRITRNSRFTDQKCIPDVVNAVAECILEYVGDDLTATFTKNDIWHADFSSRLVASCFSKPHTEDRTMASEYDKFFSQPMKMLAAADVLTEFKDGVTNRYVIKEVEILRYIAMREKNALAFLDIYLTKVMEDSGCMDAFDHFFTAQDKNSFNALRDRMMSLYKTYTQVKKDLEPPRIFNKIINILAFRRHKRGTLRGGISRYPVTIEEIRYNRINWRDFCKPKDMSRQDYALQVGHSIGDNSAFYEREVNKAKKFVREIEPYSEVHPYPAYKATEAHHIFMKSDFPELADMPENIIALTATEHYGYAHPNRNTQRTDPDYQMICLISKLDSIERNFQNHGDDYSLADFAKVLNTGLDTEMFSEQMGYEGIKANLLKFLRPLKG